MRRIRGLLAAGSLTVVFLVLIFVAANSVTAKSRDTVREAQSGSNLIPAVPGTFLTGPNEGDPLAIAMNFLRENRAELQMSQAEVSNLVVTDQYLSRKSGTTHIYLVQSHNGIEVYNAVININIAADGSIINVGNRGVPDLTAAVQETEIQLSAVEALERAAEQLQLDLNQTPVVEQLIGGAAQAVVLSDSGVSQNAIPARLIYQPMAGGAVRLAWDLTIYELSGEHWWSVRVDVVEGEIISRDDYIDHDNWGAHQGHSGAAGQDTTLNVPLVASAVPSSYLVYAMPVESPNYAVPAPPADARTIELSPWLDAPTASPMGWHSNTTQSWTDTQGNNVDSHKDAIRFDCGPLLECDPPLDLTMEPTIPTNVDAATVNLFYWNNILHDVTYEYGFDEPAGNFQNDNFGLGGLGNDRVNANAQAPGNCNAQFGTPPDGSQPTMNMFICNNASPARDGDLDNGVIAHEFGHGVSNRLTGGPGNVSCLNNAEQMGEGWSDLLGLLLTMEVGDSGTDVRPIGTWLLGEGPNGPGVRDFPYTTDMGINPHTYNDIIGVSSVHDIGEVWASIVWEAVWALTDEHGFNPDFYGDYTTGGNNLAIQLMLEGMKLQPCSPGFVDGRDAILLADQNFTGGQNQCLLWEAFAKRGLGFSADQGSSSSTSDNSEAFDTPLFCEFLDIQPVSQNICAGGIAEYTISVGQALTPNINMAASGQPAGATAAFSPNPVTTVPSTTTLTIDNTGAAVFGSYTLTITATDSVPTSTNIFGGLNVFDATPGSTTLITPTDGATAVNFTPYFEWTAASQELDYLIEVDDDPGFGSINYSAVVSGTSHQSTVALSPLTTFYWRVTPMNSCGSGPTSSVFSFTTTDSSLKCNTGVVDFNVNIPADWTVTASGNTNVFWTDLASCGEGDNWTGGSGGAACASSDMQGGGDYDTELRTPPIDLSGVGLPTLIFKANYQNNTLDFLDIDVSANGGISWTTVLSWNEDHGALRSLPGEEVTLDLWQYAGQEIIIRWRYHDPSGSSIDDLYVQIDDVEMSCPVGPSVRLEKTVGADPNVCAETDEILQFGDGNATYCYEVTNTGTVTLTTHDLVDTELGSILSSFPYTLSPAGSVHLTETAFLTQTTINTGTWTAYNAGPTDVTSDTDTARVKVVQPAQLPVNEGFEAGELPFYMYSEVTTNGDSVGRVQVTNSNPHSGTYALDIDTLCNAACSPNTLQAAILMVDLGGVNEVFLDFWVDEHGDENNPEDGVFVSDDGGVTWALIHSLNDSPQSYTNVFIDLDDAVAGVGMNLVDGFLIKFQSFDNFSIGTDGYSFDDIQVYAKEPTPGPAIELRKTVGTDPNICAPTDEITLIGGGEVTYCYEATNTGTVTFTLHDLEDSEFGTILNGFAYTLTSPFESVFVTQTAMVTQTTVSSAAWTAYNPGPADVVSDTYTATVKVIQPTQLPVNEGFESGDLPDYMYSEVTVSGSSTGRVEVTNTHPHNGSFALNIDTRCDGTCSPDTIQAAVLIVDLGSVSQVILDFWVDEHSDEDDPEDGVFVSDDGGATWAKIHDLQGSPQTYTNVVIDLDVAVANVGMTLVDGFLIKFQSMDEFEITTDGYSFDDIQIFEEIPEEPIINISTGSLDATIEQGESMTHTLTISNTGNADLDWSIVEGSSFVEGGCGTPGDLPWVSVSPASGSTPPGGNDDVSVLFDAVGLDAGDYEGELCITSDAPDSPEVVVNLTLTVLQTDAFIYLPAVHKADTATAAGPELDPDGLLPLAGIFLLPAVVLGWRKRR